MLTTRHYGLVDADGFITQSTAREVDDEAEAPRFATSQNYQPLSGPVDWSAQPTPTSRLRYLGAEVAPEWEETLSLADLQAAATIDIDRHADAARLSVVGDAARIKEYERAQQQAEAFKAGGYAPPAPASVAAWATAKEWADQQACDDILAAAARWLAALDGIRALRLKAKEDVRRATEAAQIAPIVSTFTATLTAAMNGVA